MINTPSTPIASWARAKPLVLIDVGSHFRRSDADRLG